MGILIKVNEGVFWNKMSSGSFAIDIGSEWINGKETISPNKNLF